MTTVYVCLHANCDSLIECVIYVMSYKCPEQFVRFLDKSVASLTASSLLHMPRTVCMARTSTQGAALSRQNLPGFVQSLSELFSIY